MKWSANSLLLTAFRKRLQPKPPPAAHPQAAQRRSLSGRRLRVARFVWLLLMALALGILVASLPGYADKLGGRLGHGPWTDIPPSARFFAASGGVASLASALLSLALAALLFRRRFAEPMAALLSFYLLLYGVVLAGPIEFAAVHWLGSAGWAILLQSLLLSGPTVAILMLFPTGGFVPGWTRWVTLLTIPWTFLLLPVVQFDQEAFRSRPILSAIAVALYFVFFGIGFYAQRYRYRNAASWAERQQIRWALYGFGLLAVWNVVSGVPFLYLNSLPPDIPMPWWAPLGELGWWLSLNIVPVCLTVAITRYRLWDIDVVINRTLVYGALTTSVVAVYALVVGAMGLLFGTADNRLVPLVATVLAALLFHPIRQRLQRGINRLMYGVRDEPFEVLAQLGERLENSLSSEMVFPTIVETVSQTLKLPYAAIAISRHGELEIVESYGRPVPAPVIYPLAYRGELVGELQVARRAADEPFTEADERILRTIARQAGEAVHAVQLMADLQWSRQQLVTAREEERRRLRRDLHDGLGPQLASQTLTIDAIDKLLAKEPERARALLRELKSQSRDAVQDIRRLVYALRPPALDELGLEGALREEAAKVSRGGLRVTVAASPLPPLPAAVEVAAYRIAQEALANVVRHAQASHCTIELAIAGQSRQRSLRVAVEDNGQGVPPAIRAGVGLQSMRERAAELGGSCQIEGRRSGGTSVTALFPLAAAEVTS
jgi:signal transduction histidine kinase